jgi:hypothetical protein
MPYEGSARVPDLLLVGCVETQLSTMAPARELYQGPVFTRRCEYAQASGLPWFVLSSRWGLVRPDELVAPSRLSLADQPSMYRRAWGRLVAEQLAAAFPLRRGMVVELHAEDVYVDSVRSSLQHLELVVAVGARSFSKSLVR